MRTHRIERLFVSVLVIILVISALALSIPQRVAEGECNVQHTVQSGETLFRISLRYGVSMQAIAAANGIANINLIYIGQVLYIPCTGSNPDGVYIAPSNPDPYQSQPQYSNNLIQPDDNCSGFVGTSPDAFTPGSTFFYWDPPQRANVARYQVRILSEAGTNVGSFEILAPTTNLVGDTSIANIGEGTKFYWYVVAVLADETICQTPTRFSQREWPNGPPPPTSVPVPTAVPTGNA